MLALSRGFQRQAELNRGLKAHLHGYKKWLYLSTNIPYFVVAYETSRAGSALPWCGATAARSRRREWM